MKKVKSISYMSHPIIKMLEEKKIIAEVIGRGGDAKELESKGIRLVNPLREHIL